jgi:dienelactone hydrolase
MRLGSVCAPLALVVGFTVAPANGQIGAGPMPGIVIVDPAAGPASSRSRAMASQLAGAGYATAVVKGDPLAAAAVLRKQPNVRSDDIGIIGYGDGASAVLATLVERYDLDVAHQPIFRSAVAFDPNCGRRYGDWVGHSLANIAGPGSTGAPHQSDAATAGLYRTPTPLLIVGGQTECRDLARDSFGHEYFVMDTSDTTTAPVLAFIAENAQYSVVSFPSSQSGTTMIGELTLSEGNGAAPAIIISPGTAGIEGFSFWERPWARRLRDLGFASLIVDSYLSRNSSWKNHWRIDARTVRAVDLLDAETYLAKQPFVRPQSIGVIGRSSGGTAILAAIVQTAQAPATLPPFVAGARPPFSVAVADYGYCQLGYGNWPGGTPASSAAIAYRTDVPLLIQVGADDQTVSANACEALVESARDAGISIDLQVYPNATHRFDAGVLETAPATIDASVSRITSFIQAHSL